MSPKPPLPMAASEPTSTIPGEMWHAIKKQHDLLNALIIKRLAVALPPRTSSLETYGRGLALFARIYYVFESATNELSMSKDCLSENQLNVIDGLFVKGLRRSSRLRNDLAHVCKLTGVDVERTLQVEQDLMAERIRSALHAKPHLLVAYSWVMYMAIFAGGRTVRKQLIDAGPEFWGPQEGPVDSEKHESTALGLPGFTFLCFDGDQDGKDIRVEFKARLAAVEQFLTQQQRQEIVGTAKLIIDNCIALVGILDSAVEQRNARTHGTRGLWLCVAVMVVSLVCWYLTSSR